MRVLAISFAVLLTTGVPPNSCSMVEVLTVQPSSQNVRIAVLKDGKPVPDVKLVVSGTDGQIRFNLSTNRHGATKIRKLAPGNYCIMAVATPTLRADLCLAVSRKAKKATSSFSMDLIVKPRLPPTLEEELEAAEATAPNERIREFAGDVEDPSGAVVPNVDIEVFRRGDRDKAHALKLRTDQRGRFSAALADGVYTAVFQIGGFQTRLLTVELAKDAVQQDLRVNLKLGLCT